MSFSFFCPNCNQELEAEEDWGGEKVECPKCKKTLTIPIVHIKKDSIDSPQENDTKQNKEAILTDVYSLIGKIWKRIDSLAEEMGKRINNKLKKQYPPKAIGWLLICICVCCVFLGKKILYPSKKTIKVDTIAFNKDFERMQREIEETNQAMMRSINDSSANDEIIKGGSRSDQNDKYFSLKKSLDKYIDNNNYKGIQEIKSIKDSEITPWDIYCAIGKAANKKDVDANVMKILLDWISVEDAKKYNGKDKSKSDHPFWLLNTLINNKNTECAKLIINHGGFEIDKKVLDYFAELHYISLDDAFDNDGNMDKDLCEFIFSICPSAQISSKNLVKLAENKHFDFFKKFLFNCTEKWNKSNYLTKQIKEASPEMFDYIVRMGACLDDKLILDLYNNNKDLLHAYYSLPEENRNKVQSYGDNTLRDTIIKNDDSETLYLLLKNHIVKLDSFVLSINNFPPKCFSAITLYCEEYLSNEKEKIKRSDNELSIILKIIAKDDNLNIMNRLLETTTNTDHIDPYIISTAPKSFSRYIRFSRENNIALNKRGMNSIFEKTKTNKKISEDTKFFLTNISNDDFAYIVKSINVPTGLFDVLLQLGQWDKAKTVYDKNSDSFSSFSLQQSLNSAVESGSIDAIKFLLNKGVNINYFTTSYAETALNVAVRNGNLKVVKFLLDSGANIELSNNYNNNIAIAFDADSPDVYDYLISKGASIPNSLRNAKMSAFDFILFAAEKNKVKFANYLLKKKNNDKYWKEPALLCAFCYAGNIDMVQKCINQGTDINSFAQSRNMPKKKKNELTGMDLTDYQRSRYCVGYPLSSDPDNIETYSFYPLPILSAIASQNIDLIKLLIKKGANINFNSDAKLNNEDFFECPITLAIKTKNIEIVQLLIDNGVDLHQYNNWNFWEIMYDSMFNSSRYGLSKKEKEIQNLLITNGISCRKRFYITSSALDVLSSAGSSGWTPLELFVTSNDKDMVSCILEHDKGIQKSSAMAIACRKNNTEMMELIYKSNINLNESYSVPSLSNHDEKTYIIISAIWKDVSLSTVQWLIDHKANVNVQDSNGYTPLHKAAMNQDIPVIQLLIKSGAKTNIKDKDGKTPADVTNNKQIKLLLSK